MDKFNFEHICYITKTENGLDWPLSDKKMNQGVYQLWYKGEVIKNGCWGEGNTKSINSRISAYRSVINNLEGFRNGTKKKNGSFNTVDLIDKRLQVGEKVEMKAVALPDTKEGAEGLPWKVDLYMIEEHFKNKHKDTIWLI
jgi:hypothetical protein